MRIQSKSRRDSLRFSVLALFWPLTGCGGGGSSEDSVAAAPQAPGGTTDNQRGGLGSGTATGTYASGTWTPGRDAAGTVNAVSWALVPLNTWVEVNGTRLDALDTAVLAAVPAFHDYGVEGWTGVTNDWCGFAIDQPGSRVWLTGGERAATSTGGNPPRGRAGFRRTRHPEKSKGHAIALGGNGVTIGALQRSPRPCG